MIFFFFLIQDAGFINKSSKKPPLPCGSYFPLREGRNCSLGHLGLSDPLAGLLRKTGFLQLDSGSSSLGLLKFENRIIMKYMNSLCEGTLSSLIFGKKLKISVHCTPCIVKSTFKICQVGLKFLSGSFILP